MKCGHDDYCIKLTDKRVERILGYDCGAFIFKNYIDIDIKYRIIKKCNKCNNFEEISSHCDTVVHEYITPISFIKHIFRYFKFD